MIVEVFWNCNPSGAFDIDSVSIHLFLDRAVAQGIVIVKKTDKRLDQYLLPENRCN